MVYNYKCKAASQIIAQRAEWMNDMLERIIFTPKEIEDEIISRTNHYDRINDCYTMVEFYEMAEVTIVVETESIGNKDTHYIEVANYSNPDEAIIKAQRLVKQVEVIDRCIVSNC